MGMNLEAMTDGPFSRKRMVLIIRLLVIIITAYVIVFTPASPDVKNWGYIFIAFYLFTNLVVAAVPETFFFDDRVFYFIIFFDSIMLPAGIYFSGYVGSDLYLIYFLILCLTTMSARFHYLMVNIAIFAAIYAWMLYQNGLLTGSESISYALRIPFMVTIALFYGYIVSARMNDKEDRLRTANEQYEQIVQATDVLVYSVDKAGHLLFANSKFVNYHGFSKEIRLLGRPYADLYASDESRVFLDKVDRVYQHNDMVQFESYDQTNHRWFSNTLSPIRNPADNSVFAVCVVAKDITERVEREKELDSTIELLRTTRDQLIQKDKMASLGRMASGVAHEIRNPLEIIAMGVDYLDFNLQAAGDNVHQSLEKISNAVDRANRIIDDVLSFSRKSDFQVKDVAICELLKEVITLAAHHIDKNGVTVRRDYADESIKVAADWHMLEQVLLNLVNNAVDAIAESPQKHLALRVYRKKVTTVGYKTGYRRADFFKVGDSMVVVEIADTGKGISEDDFPKIFEPFFTTKDTGKGTGLGLSLAHMIMDRLSGTIDVESQVDEGTTFYVKLQPWGENNNTGELINGRDQKSPDHR
ncbi:MAG: ATP-binding protein [Desulfobacterales bacterium]|nr:ATP-binding protein [Desulfobacterales bacterium]